MPSTTTSADDLPLYYLMLPLILSGLAALSIQWNKRRQTTRQAVGALPTYCPPHSSWQAEQQQPQPQQQPNTVFCPITQEYIPPNQAAFIASEPEAGAYEYSSLFTCLSESKVSPLTRKAAYPEQIRLLDDNLKFRDWANQYIQQAKNAQRSRCDHPTQIKISMITANNGSLRRQFLPVLTVDQQSPFLKALMPWLRKESDNYKLIYNGEPPFPTLKAKIERSLKSLQQSEKVRVERSLHNLPQSDWVKKQLRKTPATTQQTCTVLVNQNRITVDRSSPIFKALQPWLQRPNLPNDQHTVFLPSDTLPFKRFKQIVRESKKKFQLINLLTLAQAAQIGSRYQVCFDGQRYRVPHRVFKEIPSARNKTAYLKQVRGSLSTTILALKNTPLPAMRIPGPSFISYAARSG